MNVAKWTLTILLLAAPAVRAGELSIDDPVTLAEGRVVARPQAAYGAGVYLAVWRNGWSGLSGPADILAIRLEPGTLRALDAKPIAVCTFREAQDEPRVAFRDGLFLVVWQDFRNGKDFDIRGALVDARTGELKREDFSIAEGEGNQVCPAVAVGDDGFLVVWQDWRGEGRYGISSRRVAPTGELHGTAPLSIADLGARPAAARSGDQMLVCWVTGHPRGVTSAALLGTKEGTTVNPLGTIISCCPEQQAVTGDGNGNFMVVAARATYPDPWGWGGPGAVVCARVTADGQTPEKKIDYGYRSTFLSERKVPNVVDAASWGKKPNSKWDAGAVGGFPGTADGLWPHGWPAVAFAGDDTYLFAWSKGRIGGDRLTLEQYDVWLRGMEGRSLAVRVPDRKVTGQESADETRPVLVAGPGGEILLLYEAIVPEQGRRIVARRVRWSA